MRRAVAIATAAAALLAAAPAHATLVYVKNAGSIRYRPSVWVANDDGSAPRRLVTGRSPRISPDGAQVLYALQPRNYRRSIKLQVVPTAGGTAHTLLTSLSSLYELHWSSDNRHVLAVQGSDVGAVTLKLIDVPSRTSRTIAKGYFYGFGFSPDGQQIVYTRAPHEVLQLDSDLFVVAAAGGTPRRIPTNNPALSPVWGPQFIGYSQARLRKADAPILQIHRVNADGTGNTVMTHTRVPKLVSGLTPTEFSADGTRLLAQFGGQDTSYAVAVDPATGAEHVLGPKSERGLVATRLSDDGSTVLAASGGFDESGPSNIVTIPWAGGKTTRLVRNADEPDWDR